MIRRCMSCMCKVPYLVYVVLLLAFYLLLTKVDLGDTYGPQCWPWLLCAPLPTNMQVPLFLCLVASVSAGTFVEFTDSPVYEACMTRIINTLRRQGCHDQDLEVLTYLLPEAVSGGSLRPHGFTMIRERQFDWYPLTVYHFANGASGLSISFWMRYDLATVHASASVEGECSASAECSYGSSRSSDAKARL